MALLAAEEAQLEAARSEVLDRVEQHRAVALELTQRRGEEEQTLQRVRETFAENEVMVIALREELSDKRSRLSSLQEIAKNYEGFDRGVRAVMARAGAEPEAAGRVRSGRRASSPHRRSSRRPLRPLWANGGTRHRRDARARLRVRGIPARPGGGAVDLRAGAR